MSDSKCQRLDAISGRDQMAEKPPTEEASRRFRSPVCYEFLDYLSRMKRKKKYGGIKMDANEYQKLAMRTNDRKATKRLLESMLTCDMEYLLLQNLVFEDEQHLDLGGIFNACLGLSGEVGELNDMIKKLVFHEKELDMEHAKKETGDILWYVAMLCESFGWDMGEIMQMNVDKLRARHPDGFDVERANHRAEGDV